MFNYSNGFEKEEAMVFGDRIARIIAIAREQTYLAVPEHQGTPDPEPQQYVGTLPAFQVSWYAEMPGVSTSDVNDAVDFANQIGILLGDEYKSGTWLWALNEHEVEKITKAWRSNKYEYGTPPHTEFLESFMAAY